MENTTQNNSSTSNVDTHSYKGWMNSDSFLKRAFGVLGHYIVAALIVAIPFYILLFFVFGAFFRSIGSGSY